MFTRDLIIWGCFFVLSGCVYDDEPMPEIVEDYTRSGKVIKPVIRRPTERRRDISENIPADWFPARHLEDKKRWHGIIIHHSGSYYGSAAHEHKYHKSIGWDGLGYYFVINNGIFKNGYGRADGLVEVGYRWRGQQTGSHCRPSNDYSNYWNKHTIGICLIGNFSETRPTERQWRSLQHTNKSNQGPQGYKTDGLSGEILLVC
jgi:hypothetical protein